MLHKLINIFVFLPSLVCILDALLFQTCASSSSSSSSIHHFTSLMFFNCDAFVFLIWNLILLMMLSCLDHLTLWLHHVVYVVSFSLSIPLWYFRLLLLPLVSSPPNVSDVHLLNSCASPAAVKVVPLSHEAWHSHFVNVLTLFFLFFLWMYFSHHSSRLIASLRYLPFP